MIEPTYAQINTLTNTLGDRLPAKASALLLLALKDLEACEKDPRYEIDMGKWHKISRLSTEPHCQICLAGAVMARVVDPDGDVLDYDIEDLICWASPMDINTVVESKLHAIDCLRCGFIHLALGYLSIPPLGYPDLPKIVPVVPYEANPHAFRCAMQNIVGILESAGL